MRTGFCRHCKHDLYSDTDYYGYCSIACCTDFASDQRISNAEAKDINFRENERNYLEDKISQLECDYHNVANEVEETYRDVDRAEDEIRDLKKKVKELANVDWERIKKERKEEKAYNMTVLIKVKNIKEDNECIKENMSKVRRDNTILLEQNLDLLQTIKEMRSYSDRFNNIDLGIELEDNE